MVSMDGAFKNPCLLGLPFHPVLGRYAEFIYNNIIYTMSRVQVTSLLLSNRHVTFVSVAKLGLRC